MFQKTMQQRDPAAPQERATTVKVAERDFTLSYKEAKRGDTVVVFIHGIGDSKEDYAKAFERKDLGDYSLLAVDLVGFGKSSKPKDYTYPIEDQAKAIAALVNDRGYKKVHVVCHSVGGAVGVLLTDHLGDKLASVLNIEGNMIGADCGRVTRDTADATFEKYSTELWEGRRQRLLARGSSIAAHEAMAKEAFYNLSKSVVAISDTEKLLEKFTALKVPHAYMYGELNKEIPVIARLGDTAKIEIPKSGHRPMEETPEVFFTEVAKFIRSAGPK